MQKSLTRTALYSQRPYCTKRFLFKYRTQKMRVLFWTEYSSVLYNICILEPSVASKNHFHLVKLWIFLFRLSEEVKREILVWRPDQSVRPSIHLWIKIRLSDICKIRYKSFLGIHRAGVPMVKSGSRRVTPYKRTYKIFSDKIIFCSKST